LDLRVRKVFLDQRATKDFPAARDQEDLKATGARRDRLDFPESTQCRVYLARLDLEDLLASTGVTEQRVNLEYHHRSAALAHRDPLDTRVLKVRKEILVRFQVDIKD